MRRRPRRGTTFGVGVLCLSVAAGALWRAAPVWSAGTPPTLADSTAGTGSFVLTAHDTGPTYAPTFTGNGELGVRVPPAGQGYEGGTVPTQSELAGFYATPPGGVDQRANIPTWSTLTVAVGGAVFGLTTGTTTGWRQSIDLRTGIITTAARWTAPDGRVTDLTYQVLTDRARPDVGLVRLTLDPQWSGTATVTDEIDGTPANLSFQTGKGWSPVHHRDWVGVQAVGTPNTATVASQLGTSANLRATATPVDAPTPQSVGQRLVFPVVAHQGYTVTKYVAVVPSEVGGNPAFASHALPPGALSTGADDLSAAAQAQAASAAATGFRQLVSANDAAWALLWAGRIDVLGDPSLATEVNASEFALWSSTRDGLDWSVSPAGLSSNGYHGHIFWDADTWMEPALLAQHPDLAAAMSAYRVQRLGAAEDHARATGYRGARFPWESAFDGTEQIPPPASVFTEGIYEQHITADVALAQWQYYLATGDRAWLAQQGWPVLSQAAAFWASRVTPGPNGSVAIDGVTGPDEENPDVDNEVYTAASARDTLLDAVAAARILGHPVPAAWPQLAARLQVLAAPRPMPGAPARTVPEFDGYAGQLVKQADVTMLEYPLDAGLPPAVEQADLDYYTPRTDPGGPSMSDSIAAIDTAVLGTPGCSSAVFTERSVAPFIRDDFDQFSETRTGGAFTFLTGIGGFLQEFLYGYPGLRLGAAGVTLSPSLTVPLGGVVLHDLRWHGRRFTVAVGPHATTVSLSTGTSLPVFVGGRLRTVQPGRPLTVATRRPDLVPTADVARCGDASATSSQAGAPALAAVDGSPATDWQPTTLPATLTAPVSGPAPTVRAVTLQWGQQWPPATLTHPAPPGPVVTLRASDYTVAVSPDGATWRTVATVAGRTSGRVDVLSFPATRARAVRVVVTASTAGVPPELDELTVTRAGGGPTGPGR